MNSSDPPIRVGAPNSESIERRRLQLKNFEGSETAKQDVNNGRPIKIQFLKKFMFLDSVTQQDDDEVRRLLSESVDVNYTNNDGISALHQVCIDGNIDICKILLEYHPNINARDNDGWSPLHAASQCGFTDIAQLLLEAGADVACVDNEGQLPIDKAEDDDMRECLASWMRKKGVNLQRVITAEEREIHEACAAFIKSGRKEMDIVTVEGATLLHCAAAKGLTDCIDMLAKAKVNLNYQDNDGWTALHGAAKWGQPDAIDCLIKNGADIHLVNIFAETPLDMADYTVSDLLQEYYVRDPPRVVAIVPGVSKFLNPFLPDPKDVQPIVKGSRKKRENKENQPVKLPKETETKVETVPDPKTPTAEAGPAGGRKRPVRPALQEPTQDDKRERLTVPAANSNSTEEGDVKDPPAEINRKRRSRQKLSARVVTQGVDPEHLRQAMAATRIDSAAAAAATNGTPPEEEKKEREAPVQVIIDPKGALVWESTANRKSPETDTPSPSDKAEVLRKTEAKRKRGERRSTQQVKLEDLPDALTPEKPAATEDPVAAANRENHLQSELELERVRYDESAAALIRNQEDLRKRELKITSLEKENELMKKKIADLEEDLRRFQQVSSDNQRLRDENAALIRVIGKLSRNPL